MKEPFSLGVLLNDNPAVVKMTGSWMAISRGLHALNAVDTTTSGIRVEPRCRMEVAGLKISSL